MQQSFTQRAASFLWAQLLKSLYKPSRLFYVPLNYVVRLLRPFCERALPKYPAFMRAILVCVPERWMTKGAGREFFKAVGYELLQRDHPATAWRCLEPSLRTENSTTDEYIMGAICLYHGLGRFRDAMSLLKRASAMNLVDANSQGLGSQSERVLDNVWARHIGHTATIDYVIKLGILEGRNFGDTVIYLPAGSKVANRFLLSQVAQYVRIISEPTELPFDVSSVQAVHYDYLAPRLPDQTTSYFWGLAASTYNRWQDEGRGPIFKLPSEIEERGWETLKKIGVPQDGWFVVLHVREAKWAGGAPGIHGILNSEMSSYLPAISEITSRGGWVIRIGDPEMSRMPDCPNVFDYCHSDVRSDWMDIFLMAGCRFMLGSASGPALIPAIYGVPAILSNWWPPAQRPWHSSDIFIPKLIRKVADGRYLTLSESLCEPFAWCHSRRYLAEQEGVEVDAIDPETIKGAVKEMLDRLEGKMLIPNELLIEAAGRADKIYMSYGVSGRAKLADAYISRYVNLIE